ncbi:hypothetical protein SMMN14_04208 [Sphaerulina musiva]
MKASSSSQEARYRPHHLRQRSGVGSERDQGKLMQSCSLHMQQACGRAKRLVVALLCFRNSDTCHALS